MEDKTNHDYHEDEIDLYELLGVLWKKKGLIVLIVAVCVICAGVYAYSKARVITSEMVKLSFSGIDKHAYPDGSAFDMHDLIAPDILQKASGAISNAPARQAFLTNPRSYIIVRPIIPKVVIKEAERMEKDPRVAAMTMKAVMESEKNAYVYRPNQFSLLFIEPKDGPFESSEKEQLLLGIKSAFEDTFKERFIRPNLLALDLSKDEFSKQDYTEQVKILDERIEGYLSFLNARIKNAGHYRSSKTGDSFVDIAASLKNLNNSFIKVNAAINTMHLTKSKKMQEEKHVYKIKMIEKDQKKKQEEALIAQDMLNAVWKREHKGQEEETTNLAGASQNGLPAMMMDADALEKLSQKEYISMLIKKTLDARVQASSLKVDREFEEQELAALQGVDMDAGKDYRSFIENELESTRSRVMELGSKANALNREYLEKRYSHIIQVQNPPRSFISYHRNPRKIIPLSFVASLFLAIFIAFFMEYISNARKRNVRGGKGD